MQVKLGWLLLPVIAARRVSFASTLSTNIYGTRTVQGIVEIVFQPGVGLQFATMLFIIVDTHAWLEILGFAALLSLTMWPRCLCGVCTNVLHRALDLAYVVARGRRVQVIFVANANGEAIMQMLCVTESSITSCMQAMAGYVHRCSMAAGRRNCGGGQCHWR